MEKFQEYREEAYKRLKIADHLLTVTYPMVKDTRLLLTVVENLYACFENGMNAILAHELLFKQVNVLPDSFEPRFALLNGSVGKKHKVDPEHIKALKELRDIIISHKESPVEFAKDDMFVICGDNYNMKKVTVQSIKKYIGLGKVFTDDVARIVSEHEGIFRGS